MRYTVLVMALVLAFQPSARGQQNQQPTQQNQQPPRNQPPVTPPDPRLDALLAQWEGRMTGLKSLKAKIAREDFDKAFGSKQLFTGTAMFQVPNLARLDLVRQDNPSIYERFVCTGQFTFQFLPSQKLVRVYDMGLTKKGQPMAEDNFLSFLVGMKAADAKIRYDIRLTGEDANYVYLAIKPRNPADMADFSLAELALTQKSFLPRTLRYTEANGNVATWDIPLLEVDVPIDRRYFEQPPTPPGFQLKRMPRLDAKPEGNGETPPRVIRQQGPG
jgi:TIGR03009 family protein